MAIGNFACRNLHNLTKFLSTEKFSTGMFPSNSNLNTVHLFTMPLCLTYKDLFPKLNMASSLLKN